MARENGVTMSWIIRALIRKYRKQHPQPPRFKRPHRLKGKYVRFSLKLYGDKQELLTFARADGGEFSPFVREVLELWMAGLLTPNLKIKSTVRRIKELKLHFSTKKGTFRPKYKTYNREDLWAKDPLGNLWWMERGLARRKHPLPD